MRLDLPEIQGEPKQIVTAKAQGALALLQRPLLLEDVSVHCEAINGLPGPYAKDFLIALGELGLYELIHKYENHSAHVTCLVAFAKQEQSPSFLRESCPDASSPQEVTLNMTVIVGTPSFNLMASKRPS